MYVRPYYRRSIARPRGLGAWCDFLGPGICWGSPTFGAKPDGYYALTPAQQAAFDAGKPVPATPAPASSSSFTDFLLEAATGHPANSAIQSAVSDCVTQVQRMRTLYPNNVPAGAEQQCFTDVNAYRNLIGGTAQDVLANVIPNPAKIGTTAVLVLAAIVGGILILRS